MVTEERTAMPRGAVVGLAAATLVFAALAMTAYVREGTLLAVDRPVADAIVDVRAPWLTSVMHGLSLLGSRAVLAGMLISLTLWALLTRECTRSVLVVSVVFVAAMLLEMTLKGAIGRVRPEPVLQLVATRSAAFPSGHAVASAAFFGLLPVILASRWPAHVAAWALVALISASRVYLGVHWLSDVAGGIVLGVALVCAGVLLLRGHRLDPKRCPDGHVAEP